MTQFLTINTQYALLLTIHVALSNAVCLTKIKNNITITSWNRQQIWKKSSSRLIRLGKGHNLKCTSQMHHYLPSERPEEDPLQSIKYVKDDFKILTLYYFKDQIFDLKLILTHAFVSNSLVGYPSEDFFVTFLHSETKFNFKG